MKTIERLPELDMTVEQTRTFFGCEWIDRYGQAICKVLPHEPMRETYARGCMAAGAVRVVTYDITAPAGTDLDAAFNFARVNKRLTS
jgi:hypothetical protein